METLAIAEALEQVGIEREKAYPIAETINGKSGLATKEDLAEVEAELKADISEVKSEIAEVKNDQKWLMRLGIVILGGIIGLFVLITNLSTEIKANSITNQVSQSSQK